MKATIYLNDGPIIEVNNFQSIKNNQGLSIDKEHIQNFDLQVNHSYNVIGDLTVSVMGEKIQYIEFDPKD